MEAYPQKAREVVVGAYAEGPGTAAIAERFKVSRTWARRVRQRWRDSQVRTATGQKHGPDPKLTPAHRLELAGLVQQAPDATLEQLRQRLSEPVSVSTVFRALNDMKLTLKKKSLHASEQGRPDVKLKREEWERCMPGLGLDKRVFFDEMGVNSKMARLYGRCPRGPRRVGSAPAGPYRNSTLMSAMRPKAMRPGGVVAPLPPDGPVDGEVFASSVEQHLAAAAPEAGDILVLNNLPAHKSVRVTAAVEAAGCVPAYLPPYSPDFNPSENMWSEVKTSLRGAAARTAEAVVDAVAAALRSVTCSDCEGYFSHCGYDDSPT